MIEGLKKIQQSNHQIIKPSKLLSYKHCYKIKECVFFYRELNINRLFLSGGKLKAIMESLTKVFKELEIIKNEIASQGEEMLSQVEKFPVGVGVLNEDGTIERVNDSFCKIYGYKKEELLGENFIKIIPEQHKALHKELHKKFMEHNYELVGRWAVRKKDGTTIDVLANAAYILIKDQPKQVLLMVEISNLEKIEKDLGRTIDELNKNLKDLSEDMEKLQMKLDSQDSAMGIMRHDMLKPLKNIEGMSDYLLENKLSEEEQKEWINMIKQQSLKAQKLMQVMSGLEKMEVGIYKPHVEKFDVLGLLKHIYDVLKPHFDSKELKYYLKADNPKPVEQDQPYLIHADKFFIELMLTNLITNAVEASPKKQAITIEISTNEIIEISIHNWGTVPEEIRETFFEKYVTKGKPQGTGLGTYIAKVIAESHSGMISMYSSEEEGTTVVIALPITGKYYVPKSRFY
jgi:PAS domain S-box-containing protein